MIRQLHTNSERLYNFTAQAHLKYLKSISRIVGGGGCREVYSAGEFRYYSCFWFKETSKKTPTPCSHHKSVSSTEHICRCRIIFSYLWLVKSLSGPNDAEF